MTDRTVLEDMMMELHMYKKDAMMILDRERSSMIEDYIFELDLSGLDLHYIPKSLQNLNFLEEVDLSFNNISQLPDFLLDMDNLRKIYLFDNPIPTILPKFKPMASSIEIEPDKHLPGHSVLVDLTETYKTTTSPTPMATHYVSQNFVKPREIRPNQPLDNRSYYFKLNSRLEMEQMKYLFEVYKDRTCCKLTGRFNDHYCMLCGRVIPETFKVTTENKTK